MDSQTKPVESKYISIDQLRKQRQALERELKEFPPIDQRARLIIDYQINIIEIQLECELRRKDLRTHTIMSRKRIVTRREKDLEIEEVKSFYGWEKLDNPYLDLINEKEIKGIEYFTNLINQTQNEQTTIPSR